MSMALPSHSISQFIPSQEEQQRLDQWGILRIPLETPFLSEPVNVYLVQGSPPVLIDAGLRYKDNLQRIEDAMGKVGLQLEDIGEIWLTHPHIDHFGLADDISRRANAPICTWEHAKRRFEQYEAIWTEDRKTFARLVRSAGGTEDVLKMILSAKSKFRELASPLTVQKTFSLQNTPSHLLAGRLPLQPVHIPGHSPWSIGYWLPQEGQFFSADTLLKRVRFSVILYPENECPLTWQGFPAYHATLEKLLELPIRWSLPGHGSIYSDTKRQIQRTLRQLQRRKKQTLQWLEDGTPSAYAIAISIFGTEITHNNLLLVMSEVIGLLKWNEYHQLNS